MSIPAIFVSPCSSQIEMTDSAKIQEKSRDFAKHILMKAKHLHQQGVDVTNKDESGLDLGLTTSEAELFFEEKDLVVDIIERALDLNLADSLASNPDYENREDSEAMMAIIFQAVDPDKGMTPVQSQVFFRAREMVNSTVGRAFVISSGIDAMNKAQTSGFGRVSSEVMERIEEIVRKLIRKSMKDFMDVIESGSQENTMPPPTEPTAAEELPQKSSLKKGTTGPVGESRN